MSTLLHDFNAGDPFRAGPASPPSAHSASEDSHGLFDAAVARGDELGYGHAGPEYQLGSGRQVTPPFHPDDMVSSGHAPHGADVYADMHMSSARSSALPTIVPLSPPAESSYSPSSWSNAYADAPQSAYYAPEPAPTQRPPVDPATAANNARKRATYAAPPTQRTSNTPSPPALTAEHTLHPAIAQYQTAHPRRALINFGPYILLQTLGEGEFGKVKLGVHQEYGEEVAVKLIRRGSVDNQVRLSKVEREIEVLKTVKHPNIVRLFDVIETEKYIGIILDFANGGELFDHILAHRYLKEKDASKLFAQLISGVSYLHQKHIVHRDLKLENLLLDKHRNVIITDFGFANRFEHKQDDLMATSCGSPCYAAPELVISEGLYVGSAVDIWSCGVILYAMLSGYLPFDDDPANPDGNNINLLYRYIVSTPLTFPDYISAEARDLLRKMLVPDPAHRCDLRTIMAHPWLRLYSNLFDRSVDELEVIAAEQQMHKRQASRRDMQARMRAQDQARIAQLARQAQRASGQSALPVPGTAPPHQRHQSALPSVNTMPDYLYNAGQRRPSPVSTIPTSTTSAHLASPLPLQDPPRTAPSGSSGAHQLAGSDTKSEVGHQSDSALEGSEPIASPRQRAESMQAPSTPTGKQSSRAQPLNDITPTQANLARDRENLPSAVIVEERRERKDSSSPVPSNDSKRRPASSNKNRHTIQVEYDGEAAYEKSLDLQDQRNAAWARGERVQTEQSRDASPTAVEAAIKATSPAKQELAAPGQEAAAGKDVKMDGWQAGQQQPLPTPPTSRIESIKLVEAQPLHAQTPPATPLTSRAPLDKVETGSRASSRITTVSRSSRASMPPPARPSDKTRVPSASSGQSVPRSGPTKILSAEAQANLPAPPSAARSDRRRSRMSMDKLGLSKLLSNANVSTDSFTHFGRVSSRESKAEAKLQRADSVKAKEAERQRQKEAAKDKKSRRTTMSLVADTFGSNSPGKRAKVSTAPQPTVVSSGTDSRPTARQATTSTQGSVSGTSSRSGRPTSVVIQGDRILAPRPADRSPSNPSITTFEAFAAPSPSTDGHKPVASSSAAKKVMDWFRRKSIAKGPFPATSPSARADSRSSQAAAYPGGPGILVPTSASIRTEEALLSSSTSDIGQTEDVPEVLVTPAAVVRPEEQSPVRKAVAMPVVNLGPIQPVDVVATKTSSPKRPAGAPQRAKTQRPGSLGGRLTMAAAPPTPSLAHDMRLRTHNGVVDQAALTSRPATDVMAEVQAVLFAMGIEVKRESEFKLRCLRPRRKKAGATTGLGLSSAISGGSLANITLLGNASASQTDRRGLPMPSSPSGLLSSPGGLRGMLRRGSSYAAGLTPDMASSIGGSPNPAFAPGQVAPEPVYGEHTIDIGDEVRFSVELTRIKNLPGLLSLDMKRLRGNIWSFKYIYQTVLDRCDSLTH